MIKMTKVGLAKYQKAIKLMNQQLYDLANPIFESIKDESIIALYYYYFTSKVTRDEEYGNLYPLILQLFHEGDMDANRILANYYYFGHKPCQKSYQKAVEHYQVGVKHKDAICENHLANSYYYGLGIERNINKALYYYKKAASHGLSNAMNNLGNRYRYGEGVLVNYKNAIYWYRKAAKEGLGYSQTNLGIMYQKGLGVKVSPKKAMEWFLKASEQGYGRSEDYIADSYKYGIMTEVNYAQALFWYEKAISHKNMPSLIEYGKLYFNGNGVEKNISKADDIFKQAYTFFYEQANNTKNAFAWLHLSKMYEEGLYVEQSISKMIEMYENAARLENNDAMYRLGQVYLKGNQTDIDIHKAMYWFEKASSAHNIAASNVLGRLYLEGELVAQDYEKAFNYYHIGTKQNDGEALYFTATMYYYGQSVKRDLSLALDYALKANDNNFYTAQYYIALIQKEINPNQQHDNEVRILANKMMKMKLNPLEKISFIQEELKKDFFDQWEYLSKISQNKLVSAMLSYMDKLSYESYQKLDYSGVVLELNTALEVEIAKYLYDFYLDYAFERKIKPQTLNRKDTFKSIVFNGDVSKKPKTWPYFSLGDLKIISGYERIYHQKESDKLYLERCYIEYQQNKEVTYCFDKLYLEYLESHFNDALFPKGNKRVGIMKFLRHYIDDINVIRRDFRNKAAHGILMNDGDAETCANWIIKIKKLMYQIILAYKQ